MTERRYSDDEVREIFAQAADAQARTSSRSTVPATRDGLTLQQLQEIGAEAGLGAAEIAAAAQRVVQPAPPPVPTVFGIPTGASHVVELDRRLSEEEWEALVIQLRETFRAKGTIKIEGSFRSWQNGELQVLLEPLGARHRVRFFTQKRTAGAQLRLGLWMLLFTLPVIGFAFAGGREEGMAALGVYGVISAAGLVFSGLGVLGLRGWRRTRQQQFEALANGLLRLPPRG